MSHSDKAFVDAVTRFRMRESITVRERNLLNLINSMRLAHRQRLITMTNAEVDEIFK